MARLSSLPALAIRDLDAAVLARFATPDGQQRIELRAAPGVSATVLAQAVRAAAPPGTVVIGPQVQDGAQLRTAFGLSLAAALAMLAVVLCLWIRRVRAGVAAVVALVSANLALAGSMQLLGLSASPALLGLQPLWLLSLSSALGIRAFRAQGSRGEGASVLNRAALMLPLSGLALAAALCLSTALPLVVLGQTLGVASFIALVAVFAMAPLIEMALGPLSRGAREPRSSMGQD